jgi:hypothetical protein
LSKDLSSFVNSATGGNDLEPGALSFQPELLPYFLSCMFSGTYRTGERLIDGLANRAQRQWIEAKYPNEAKSLLEDLDYGDVPVVRRFFTTTPQPRDTQRDYYEYREMSRAADQALRKNVEAGRGERAREIVGESRPELAIVEITKEIDNLRKAMKETKAQMQAAGADKERIDLQMMRMKKTISRLQQRAVTVYRKVEQNAKAQASTN